MENLTGKTFNYLTVLGFSHFDKKKNSYWLCECKCGNYKIVRRNHLLSGGVQSCGCVLKEGRGVNFNGWKTHGKYSENHRLNKIWNGMIYRCTNKKHQHYYCYGGAGIKVCDEWMPENNGCVAFFKWALKNGYKENLTIDRIDFNGDYCPKNCRWVTVKEQANNKRNNVRITYNNESKTIAEWEKETGLFIGSRLRLGYSIEEAFNLPKRYKRTSTKINYCGYNKTIKEWSDLSGIPANTIRRRLKIGKSLDNVFLKGGVPWVC